MINILKFIEFALSHADPKAVPKNAVLAAPVGIDGVWEYLWGTHGQICTEKLLADRYKSYYKKNSWDEKEYASVTKGWVENKVHVSDCQGLLDAFTGKDVNADYNYRHYCTEKGLIAAINRPWVIGEAVFNGTDSKKTHVGWVCGFVGSDPLVVEERGLKYGCTITRMSKRAWKYRGLMTAVFDYADPEPVPEPKEYVFTRILKRGMDGDDVIKLKSLLIRNVYRDGISVDNDASKHFGSATKRNVKAFQRDSGLTVDGIAGKKTITALGGIFY